METLIIYPKNKEQRNALEIILKAMKVPFETNREEKSPNNPAFVEKMREPTASSGRKDREDQP